MCPEPVERQERALDRLSAHPGRGQRRCAAWWTPGDDAGTQQGRYSHRVVDPELVDQEADDGRADQERRVAEGHDHSEYPAAADVAGNRVHLRRDHADAEADQRPAEQQQRQAAHQRHRRIAEGGAEAAEAYDGSPAEPRHQPIAQQPDHHHEAADRNQAERARGGVDAGDIGDVRWRTSRRPYPPTDRRRAP